MPDTDDQNRRVSNKFVRACAEGRHADVLILLALGEDVDQFDKGFDEGEGWVAADGNQPNSFMQNGIQMAIRNNDLKLLEILDNAGANFDFVIDGQGMENDENGKMRRIKVREDLIKKAVISGFYEGILFFQKKGYRLPQTPEEQGDLLLTSIRYADCFRPNKVEDQRLPLLKYFIEDCGYDAYYSNDRNETALSLSAERSVDWQITEYILQQGVNPNKDCRPPEEDKGSSGLRALFEKDHRLKSIVKMVDKGGTLPLCRVAMDAIRITEEDEDVNHEDDSAANALKKLRVLLAYGADPYFENNDGYSTVDIFQDTDAIKIGYTGSESADEVHKILDEAGRNYQGILSVLRNPDLK